MKRLLLILLLLVGAPATVLAAVIHVTAQDPLQEQLDRAEDGDTVQLAAGRYPGNVVIRRQIALRGQPGTLLDGDGRGHGLEILAANVVVEDLQIRNWGDDLTALDSGIFVHKQAAAARIEGVHLQGGNFGIWVDATPDVRILNNRIGGDPGKRSQDRGNGIHLHAVSGARVEGNEVWHTRDGIYIETSHGNTLSHNYLHDLRYGIHYMYSYNNRILNNLTRGTRTGYALMQSKYLTVIGNRSEEDQNYGILLNFITHSTLKDNRITGVRPGRSPTLSGGGDTIKGAEGKALFIYNSLFNEISGNRFADSDLGIHLTAGAEDNRIFHNAFIGNQTQVKYVATRLQEWSDAGRGNYWSDYLGWDMDGDGLGDTAYEPNDGIDRLLWKYPDARLLMSSPAIAVLRWVQRQFPVLKSPGVTDSFPLMRDPLSYPAR